MLITYVNHPHWIALELGEAPLPRPSPCLSLMQVALTDDQIDGLKTFCNRTGLPAGVLSIADCEACIVTAAATSPIDSPKM